MQRKRRIFHLFVGLLLASLVCITCCQCTIKEANINSTNSTSQSDDASLGKLDVSDSTSSISGDISNAPNNSSNTILDEPKQTEAQETTANPEDSKKDEVDNSNGGIIYLTFDDGPSLENTPQILDILKEENVKATFFIVNYSAEKEEIVKRQYNEGHTIGLHGYSHDYSEIYCSMDALMNNFLSLQEKVAITTGGYTSKIIRFPGGSSNTVSRKYCNGIMSEAVNEVMENGFIYFDWNVSSGDASVDMYKDSDKIYNNTITTLKPGKENVVLMHDSSGHEATRDVVRKIIKYGKENGYIFKPITEETTPVRHGINN